MITSVLDLPNVQFFYDFALSMLSGGSGTHCTGLTDLSANANNATQATDALRWYDSGSGIDRGIVNPSWDTDSRVNGTIYTGYSLPAGMAIDRRNFGIAMVVEAESLDQGGTFVTSNDLTIQLGRNLSADLTDLQLWTVDPSFTRSGSTLKLPCNRSIVMFKGSASAFQFRINNTKANVAAATAGTSTNIKIGNLSNASNQSFVGKILAIAGFSATPSDANYDDLVTLWTAQKNITTAFTKNLVISGDSKDAAIGDNQARTPSRQYSIPSTVKVWNFGVSGRQTAAIVTGYATEIAPLFDPTMDLNIVLLPQALNDMDQEPPTGGVTAATGFGSVKTLADDAKADGWLPIGRTGDAAATTNATLTKVQTFNHLVRANYKAEGWAGLADHGANVLIGTNASNTSGYFISDHIHNTFAGMTVRATTESDAIVAAIASVPGPGGGGASGGGSRQLSR